jgi:DNA-binding transcriptional ArsR family regulator
MPKDLFAALSHDTRLRCILLLSAYQELCVCELIQAIGAPQPHVSRHLAHLREAGLVSDRREGLWIHYRINPDLPTWVSALIEQTAQGVADQHPYDRDLVMLSQPSGQRDRTRCA